MLSFAFENGDIDRRTLPPDKFLLPIARLKRQFQQRVGSAEQRTFAPQEVRQYVREMRRSDGKGRLQEIRDALSQLGCEAHLGQFEK